jgi:ABC-2 type transport system ATP-binding protein
VTVTGQEAYIRLTPRATHHSPETLTLGFPTDGTARNVRELLDELDPEHTELRTFTVRTATLDDVFLSLTSPSTSPSPSTIPGTNPADATKGMTHV